MLYFVRLIPPYTKQDWRHDKPEIDSPEDVTTYDHQVYAKLLDAVVYRADTGEVLARWDRLKQ